MRQLAATFALIAVLACSSIGTCWLRLTASTGHDCCEQDAAVQSQARPCGSTAAVGSTVEVAPPAMASVCAAVANNEAFDAPPRLAAFAPSYHVFDPPLVLRI